MSKKWYFLAAYPALFIFFHILRPLEFAAADANFFPVFIPLALGRLFFYSTTLPYQVVIDVVWPYHIDEYADGYVFLYNALAIVLNTVIIGIIFYFINKRFNHEKQN